MSELGIDKLSIEISANTQSATKSIGNLTKSLNKLNSAMSPLTASSSSMNRALGSIRASSISSSKGLTTFSNSASKGAKSTDTFITRLMKLELGFIAIKAAIRTVVNAISSAFKESSSYVEVLNMMNVTFCENAESVKNFAEEVQNLMGIDSKDFIEFQSKFGTMLKGYGVASDNVKKMSQNLTQLAYDYASFFDDTPETAFDKLNSAMSGQIKGLKEYGNVVSVAEVKQMGLKYGLKGSLSSWDANTQALMRYKVIMENAAKNDVFNDMARTINTPANAMRILTNSVTQLKRALGDIASVFIKTLIPYINVFVQLCTRAAKTLAALFGFELSVPDYSGINSSASDLADSTEDTSNNLGDATKKAKELKKQLMGFDELNIINEPSNTSSSSSGSGVTGLQGIGDNIDLPEYNFIDQLNESASKTIDDIQSKLEKLFEPITNSWNTYGKDVMDSFSNRFGQFKLLMQSIGESFNEVWQNGTGEKTMNLIFGIIVKMNGLAANLYENFRKAWDENKRGTKIVQNLWNAFNSLLKVVYDVYDSMAKWTSELDFRPLLDFIASITRSLSKVVSIIGGALNGVLNKVILPALKFIIECPIVSVLVAIGSGVVALCTSWQPLVTLIGATFGPLDLVASGLDMLGASLSPLLSLINPITISIGLLTATIIDLWDESEDFRKSFTNIFKKIGEMLEKFIVSKFGPVFDKMMTVIKSVWENAIIPLWDVWKQAFGEIVGLISDLLDAIYPVYSTCLDVFDPIIELVGTVFVTKWSTAFSVVSGVLQAFLVGLRDVIKGIRTTLSGIIDFITGAFSGDWKKAWNGVKEIFKGVFGTFASVVKTPLNAVIGMINGCLSGIQTGINYIIKTINKLSWEIPSWVPSIGGKKFGFNFKSVSLSKIPMLASGGQLDNGQMFIARESGPELVGTMGGKTTVANNNQIIEGIKQGVIEAMSMVNTNQGGTTRIVVQSILDGKTIGESVVDYNNGIVKQTGASPLMI